MLFAERHGKLSRNYSRVHERAEDLLTSTAFQLLRYIPSEHGLLSVLKKTRQVQWKDRLVEVEHKQPEWLASCLSKATDYKVEFWPIWGAGVGQPDLLLTLIAASGPLGRLVVEVKLDSRKNQVEEGDEENAELIEPQVPDQLWRYWKHLSQNVVSFGGPPALGLIYLTAHAAPPVDALKQSLGSHTGDWLGWLSWRDVWAAMTNVADQYHPARDLADILAHKRLKYFTGFRPPERPPPEKPIGFWKRKWFAPPAQWKAPTARQGFWASSQEAK